MAHSEKPNQLERSLRRLKLVEAGEPMRDVYKTTSFITARGQWRRDVSIMVSHLVITEKPTDEVQSNGVSEQH